MRYALRCLLLATAMTLAASPGSARAQPNEVRNALASATLGGTTRFTSWGFNIYDASLWVQPGFKAAEYERHAFALELTYLRDFTNQPITSRSIDEMQRLPGATQAQLAAWEAVLRAAFPDIKKGDQIIGLHRPGADVVFITNGQATETIRDTDFGRVFFGIWLSPYTSEPRLREALLARVDAP